MTHEENLKRPRFLESERLFLTPLSMADIDRHFQWNNDREMSYLDGGGMRPWNEIKQKAEFEGILKEKSWMFFSVILKDSGEHIGNVVLFDISEFHRRAFWGIKLAREYWRQGFAKEASRLILAYAFNDLGLVKLRSQTHSKNPASIRLQESLGFVQEGVLRREVYVRGEYVDDLLYGMLKEEYDKLYGEG